MPDKLKSLAMTEYYLSHHCQRFSVISSIIHNSQRDAQSDASEIQLAFFSHNTCLLEHHIYDSQKQSVYPSCMMGTYCDTSHARDTDFLSTFAGLFLSMAPTGHLEAQRPHWVHALVALGTIPALLLSDKVCCLVLQEWKSHFFSVYLQSAQQTLLNARNHPYPVCFWHIDGLWSVLQRPLSPI